MTSQNPDSLKELLDTLPLGVYECNSQGNLTYVNQASRDIFGFSTDDDITSLNIFKMIAPRDFVRARENLTKLALSQKTSDSSYTGIKKDGTEFPLKLYSNVKTLKGQILGYRGVIIDFTYEANILRDLENEREKFMKAFYSSPVLYCVTEVETLKIIDINEVFTDLLGYTPQDVIGENALGMGILSRKDYLNIASVDSETKMIRNIEISLAGKSGQIVTGLLSGEDIEWRETKAMLYSFFDITHLRQIEQERDFEQIRGQRLESLGLLAGGIAHDFNNYLMGILGNIQLMEMDAGLSFESLESLEEMKKAVGNAVDLTRQLLTFSKGGQPVFKSEDIRPVIRNAVKLALSGAKSKYRTNFTPKLPFAKIDAGQISQVINNIVINANQSMAHGGMIKISGKAVLYDGLGELPLKSGRYLLIRIKDEGNGIPENVRPQIFTPYFTTKSTGHGLGLATSYSIIKKHEGFLDYDSEIGEGTEFKIYLPAAEGEVEEECQDIEIQAIFSGRVLFLDDDMTILRATSKLLECLGLEVDAVSEGSQIIEKFREAVKHGQKYVCVIMDLTIPGGIGGREVLPALLEIDPSVTAIASSGYSNVSLVSDYKEHGFKGFIQKPYDLDDLADVLKRALNS